ncbi:hypothetical protein RB636_34005 [Streptomyces chrestomyceticus]|uniref:Uncharacterized protein n=1 Tax=Streptomyces chrestomyceticus TaxID=68185 RepID=A0ABU7X5G7_9ACTN
MYSQSSIYSRCASRSAPTEEMLWGLSCVVCGTDYRSAPTADAQVVSRGAEGPTLACRGVCARLASGSATGLDETPLPLTERVRRYEARARKHAGQAQGDQRGSAA